MHRSRGFRGGGVGGVSSWKFHILKKKPKTMIQTAPENTIITRTPIPTPEKLLDPRMNTS